MGRRLDLQAKLEEILGSKNVYFQPPESVKLKYPCIVYNYATNDTKFANDRPYSITRKYTVLVIDPNPDTEIPDKIASLPMCRLTTNYTADNLNHYPFDLYY